MDTGTRRGGRRRFQFRLTTWLLAIALLSWALAERPWLIEYWRDSHPRLNEFAYDERLPDWAFHLRHELQRTAVPGIHFPLDPDGDGFRTEFALDPGLRGPLMALAAIVAWKAARGRRAMRIAGQGLAATLLIAATRRFQ